MSDAANVMSVATYGMATAVTEAAPTRKNFFALVMCTLRESRARQARREIYRHRHLLANKWTQDELASRR